MTPVFGLRFPLDGLQVLALARYFHHALVLAAAGIVQHHHRARDREDRGRAPRSKTPERAAVELFLLGEKARQQAAGIGVVDLIELGAIIPHGQVTAPAIPPRIILTILTGTSAGCAPLPDSARIVPRRGIPSRPERRYDNRTRAVPNLEWLP